MNLQQYWKSNNQNKLTLVLFAIYSIALFWILLLKLGVRFSYMENRTINLVPFYALFSANDQIDFPEIIMNIVIFVPLGVYAGMVFKKWNFGKNVFFFFLTSLMVEGIQFIFKLGSFDVTDTITNTTGGIFGWVLFNAIEKIFKSSIKAQKAINLVAAISTILMIVFLVLLKTNNLGVRYQ